MCADADNLNESLEASIFRGELSIVELQNVLIDVKNAFNRPLALMLFLKMNSRLIQIR